MRLAFLAAALAAASLAQEFVHGDECLFCHRNDIGPQWQRNSHGVAVRQREDAPLLAALIQGRPALAGAEFFLGSRHFIRFLKKEGYNRFALHSSRAALNLEGHANWSEVGTPGWQSGLFGPRCAGCHATAYDPAAGTFAAFGLDCYTCHGNVDLEHTNDTSRIWLSKERRADARAVTATCAQCHLRGGRSRSTGLPFPVRYVAGADLFADYEANLTRADDETLHAGDRHVYRSVREVLAGRTEITCLSCHRVHTNTSAPHRRVLTGPLCLDCHEAAGPKKRVKRYTAQSAICEY